MKGYDGLVFLSEDELVKRSIKGNAECYEILLKKYKNYLYKISYSYTGNESDALDIVQECVCKAWLNIKKLKKYSSFKAWIAKILINCACDYCKKKGLPNLEFTDSLTAGDNFACDLSEKIDINNAIYSLKYEYKTVLILKYFDNLTIDEIATIMGVPSNTVKTYLRRAKIAMKDILKEDYLYER
ncbi:sigma-70 family RNA polymerase sigma factor [Romboutsia lituseburensis]|uniref:RNA polymerase, sigma subunit, SigV n=1 Tax=Romboutsia lituseburensis DSM 797 TaxID=1121325 RepID=A0A1G9PMD5_9FIRM|nr:sigma-70 family RNA polymerase sigma factor [Romboutsia lituseburensis]CEH33449.1 TIGR02954 RNA polymerase sigma-70 factor [Romboutsia lituseburensis]SDL99988.1 RNA polymerase, sigma subunit, SigV [Romboutsia lituseburensis DSM 797]